MMVQQIIHQDKPYYLMCADDVPILARAFGLSEKEMREAALIGRSYGHSSVSVTSPLYVAEDACRDLLGFCRAGVAFNVSSMPSAGGTAPCSLTSALIVQNCENLGVLTLAQLVSPGHPVLYGAMGGHSDMRTLRHVYGGPENRLLELGGGRLARYYGLLVRGGAVTTDAPAVDYQAGAESMFQSFSAALAGLNFLPGCGHLGSYLAGSLEKLALDAENIEYIDRLRRPLKFGDDDLALDVIREIGPKGNFVNHPQTFKRFRGEFLLPEIFNRASFEQWRKAGSPAALELASARVEALINEYRKPDMAMDLEKSLLEFC
jgi:trimethylamine--corrinoid protein Co-methyltransferase